MEKLEKIQRRSLKYCLGLRQFCPSNVVLAEACVSQLKNRFKFLVSKYILKAFVDESNPIIQRAL